MLPSLFYISASFYGDSYINMPIQEAKISTNIRLKFKTGQENGLLFATAGRFDALTLSLHSGQLKLDFRISEHHVEVSVSLIPRLNYCAHQVLETNLTLFAALVSQVIVLQ